VNPDLRSLEPELTFIKPPHYDDTVTQKSFILLKLKQAQKKGSVAQKTFERVILEFGVPKKNKKGTMHFMGIRYGARRDDNTPSPQQVKNQNVMPSPISPPRQQVPNPEP
jgi:hypothetical protein